MMIIMEAMSKKRPQSSSYGMQCGTFTTLTPQCKLSTLLTDDLEG
jgi:hypothetical protein